MAAIDELAEVIHSGLGPDTNDLGDRTEKALAGIFGERYRADSQRLPRIALMSGDQNVPFAGLLHPDNPKSGVYGGMSLIWFPVPAEGDEAATSLITFVCGTRGLPPDEAIIGRPGHARHLRALGHYLQVDAHVPTWVKRDPTNLGQDVPDVVRRQLSRFSAVFSRYGQFIYAASQVPSEQDTAKRVVSAYVDFYAAERGWKPLKAWVEEVTKLKGAIRRYLFPRTSKQQVIALLKERRFVILQGPPGTGKSRLADEILTVDFANRGQTVQFHPAVTYESFIAGISPDVTGETLRFRAKSGWLVQAVKQAQDQEWLLVIDEINRADLGRVLGEAIYLFEPREIAEHRSRSVALAHPLEDGSQELQIPENLFILGTMNSADRSTAILDLAVRRRFAFVDVWPDWDVVEAQNVPLAREAFGNLLDILSQQAPNDALVLMPGHAYFLASDQAQLARRLRFELIPLLNEYLAEGRLGPCETELEAYLDWLYGALGHDGEN